VCPHLEKGTRKGVFIHPLHPVLNETKSLLKNKFSLSDGEVDFSVSIVTEAADETCRPAGTFARVCRDPDDDIILACVEETQSDRLVTGDNDLLVLEAYRRTRIISPRDFELLFRD
jgi:putative PIN family toxin of toxin-antitoxin system